MLYKPFLLFLLAAPRSDATLSCYSCRNVGSLKTCDELTTCSDKQSCFQSYTKKGQIEKFTLGCTQNKNCGNIPVYINVTKLSNDEQIEECTECCGFDQCNKKLCKYKTPPPCDDFESNCAFWNKAFNVCEDIHSAKRICRKFCELCDLVDGNWASWSPWSQCDVTCGKGKHTRTRTCTDPAPAYKGLDCEGSNTDYKPCIRPLCPVHGGWTDWLSWETCPVTCGAGIQKRHRTCSNPSPLRHGDHCFGDATDVQLCEQKPCDASGSTIAFNSYHVTDCSPAIDETMIFSKVLMNEGGAYNNNTGIFVAPRNGTYTFYAQLCSRYQRSMHFDIMVESKVYGTAYGSDYNYNNCESVQTIAKLKTGDRVYVQWKTYSSSYITQSSTSRNSFSGKYSSP